MGILDAICLAVGYVVVASVAIAVVTTSVIFFWTEVVPTAWRMWRWKREKLLAHKSNEEGRG